MANSEAERYDFYCVHEYFCPRSLFTTDFLFAHESHESTRISLSCVLMATCSVARIFTNSMIAFTHIISVIRATEQVALKIQIAKIRVDFLTFSAVLGITRTSSVLHSLARKFVRCVGKKKNIFVSKIIRGKKFRPYSVNARHTRS